MVEQSSSAGTARGARTSTALTVPSVVYEPAGLCLMACGYNLMHAMIEDASPTGPWWYPSPCHHARRQDFGEAS